MNISNKKEVFRNKFLDTENFYLTVAAVTSTPYRTPPPAFMVGVPSSLAWFGDKLRKYSWGAVKPLLALMVGPYFNRS